jgi:hypothetical protein
MDGTEPRSSRHADRAAAERAVALARPSIEAALKEPAVSGLGVLHVVVLDAARPPHECGFDAALLHEQSLGAPRERWDVDYAAYARDKARLSWRHAMDSRRLQLLAPHLLAGDDSALWGGIWLDGLVVAASGAMPWWDEAFSLMVAAHVRAIAFERAAPRIA